MGLECCSPTTGWLLGPRPEHRQQLQHFLGPGPGPKGLVAVRIWVWTEIQTEAQRRRLGSRTTLERGPQSQTLDSLLQPRPRPSVQWGLDPGGDLRSLLQAWTPELNHACHHALVDTAGKADLLGITVPQWSWSDTL